MDEPVRRHRLRTAISVVLIVVASVLAPLLVTTGWAVTTVTNTDRFTSTMSALAANPTVTNYIAQEGADQVVTSLKVQSRLAQRLPSQLLFLAPVLTTEFQARLTTVLEKVLQGPRFQHAWNSKIRLVHASFVKVLTTNPQNLSKGSQLVINFTPQILDAINQLDAKGITLFDPIRTLLSGDNKRILVQLADQKQFHQAQWYFSAAVKLRWILPLVFLVLAAAAILVSPRRRKAGTWLGIGVATSCVVMLVLLAFGRQYATLHAPTPPDVANAIFSTLTSYLRWELRGIALIGAIVAIALWATGPTARATAMRRSIASTGGSAVRKAEGALGEERAGKVNEGASSAVGFLVAHATVFLWVGVALAGVALAAWVDSIGALVWTILLTAAWVGVFVALRRRGSDVPQLPSGS